MLGRLCGTIICMSQNKLSLVTGISYLVVFCCAIFANFFVLEGIINNPLAFVSENGLFVRFGVIAFLVAAVADVVQRQQHEQHLKSWPAQTPIAIQLQPTRTLGERRGS